MRVRVARAVAPLLDGHHGGRAMLLVELDPTEVRAVLRAAARLRLDPSVLLYDRLQGYLDRTINEVEQPGEESRKEPQRGTP